MVDNPYRFNHARNRIANLDMVGAVSPRPGLPMTAGGDAVADYFLRHGYRYLVVVAPDAAKQLYRRDHWEKNARVGEEVWKESAHFYLEAFDAFDALRGSRVHLAEVAGMTTLDLATRHP